MIRAGVAALALIVGACAAPVRTTLPGEWIASPNFGERRPNFVVLHHTTNATVERALRTLTDPRREVSSHYLIGRDGRLYQLVDERQRAWHAGASYWGGNTDLNSSSIGIELDNTGDEAFPDVQIEILLKLLGDLKARYGIPAANFIGHGDVAPGRKDDPSRWFPWRRLAEHGFGLWCDAPLDGEPIEPLTGLQAFGYDISRPEAAIAAFRRRFTGQESTAELDIGERGLLRCLLAKKRSG
jgi:N-acetylmuramoyl-L-alanine amidase